MHLAPATVRRQDTGLDGPLVWPTVASPMFLYWRCESIDIYPLQQNASCWNLLGLDRGGLLGQVLLLVTCWLSPWHQWDGTDCKSEGLSPQNQSVPIREQGMLMSPCEGMPNETVVASAVPVLWVNRLWFRMVCLHTEVSLVWMKLVLIWFSPSRAHKVVLVWTGGVTLYQFS